MAEPLFNWKVRDADLQRVRLLCVQRRLTQAELAQQALNLLEGSPAVEPAMHSSKTGDSALTPHSEREHDLVAGLLLLFRDKREIAQGVKEIVAGLLSNWINKAKAAMPDLNGGKRSA